MRLAYILTLLFIVTDVHAQNIKPFTTDGCSVFPDGTFTQENLWLSCCTAHDYTYWQGGTFEDRLKADETLQQCVAKAGKPEIANLMFAGVRFGGNPYLPTSFRWGYGWPYPRGYKALTEQEKNQIKLTESGSH